MGGITRPPYLPLRNMYAGREAAVRTRHGTMGWFQIGKVRQGCILSPAYLTSMQSTSCEVSADEAQAGINTARRNINNLRYEDDTLMAERTL